MRRSVIDLVPAQQCTYMAAFTLIAQHIADGEGAVVTPDEIAAITKLRRSDDAVASHRPWSRPA
jgi:hypothetical protein